VISDLLEEVGREGGGYSHALGSSPKNVQGNRVKTGLPTLPDPGLPGIFPREKTK